jgi:hypothetical protein
MKRAFRVAACIGLGLLAVGSGGRALRAAALDAEDDLAIVKRAVAQAAPQAQPAPQPRPSAEAAPAARRSDKAQWLKVRVVEKGTKKTKVTVNLPLALVRAFGDLPIDCHHRHGEPGDRERCSLRLDQVLDALDKGQDLVEIDDEDKLVRVWIE